ncbi:hypothetical protein [Paenimyroides ceti]
MEIFAIILSAVTGALATYSINRKWQWGAVKTSALLSLLVALFFKMFPDVLNAYLTQNIPFVFIGASFIGMVSVRLVARYWILLIAGVVFGILYLHLGKHFVGYGGLLGLSASISLLSVMGLNLLVVKYLKAFRKITLKKRGTD